MEVLFLPWVLIPVLVAAALPSKWWLAAYALFGAVALCWLYIKTDWDDDYAAILGQAEILAGAAGLSLGVVARAVGLTLRFFGAGLITSLSPTLLAVAGVIGADVYVVHLRPAYEARPASTACLAKPIQAVIGDVAFQVPMAPSVALKHPSSRDWYDLSYGRYARAICDETAAGTKPIALESIRLNLNHPPLTKEEAHAFCAANVANTNILAHDACKAETKFRPDANLDSIYIGFAKDIGAIFRLPGDELEKLRAAGQLETPAQTADFLIYKRPFGQAFWRAKDASWTFPDGSAFVMLCGNGSCEASYHLKGDVVAAYQFDGDPGEKIARVRSAQTAAVLREMSGADVRSVPDSRVP